MPPPSPLDSTAGDASPRRALVAGGSGLVGGILLRALIEDADGPTPTWGEVVAIGRQALPLSAQRLEQRVVSFDDLEAAALPAVDDVFCCLGTTLARAGSAAAFRRVDHDYVLALGRWALAHGARQLVVMSSMSASRRSPLLYSRVKGEVEAALEALGLPALQIVRPSLLVGQRAEQRPGERRAITWGLRLAPLLPRSARPIAVDRVARAMVVIARACPPGCNRFRSDRLLEIAARGEV